METLQIELLKLKRAGNYILLGLALGLTIPYVSLGIYAYKSGAGPALGSIATGGEHFLIMLLLFIFLCMNIGKEYSENTLRRSIIEGYSRHRFFLGKLLLICISSLFASILYLTAVGLIGVISKKYDMFDTYFNAPSLINIFIDFFATGVLALFLAFITRSVTMGIIFYFVWQIVESMIIAGQKLLMPDAGFNISAFLPLSSIRFVLDSSEIIAFYFVFVVVFYLLVMLFVPYWLFVKQDIK